MNKQETARLKDGLHSAGWNDKAINDFLIFLKTGNERYRPTPDNNAEKQENE